MRNDQAQTPKEGLDKNEQNKRKTKNENNSNDKGYNKSNNSYGENPRTASLSHTSSKNFEGEEPSIGVVLGLHFRKIEKKLPFKISREKIGNYISRTMKYGNEVVGIVEMYEDVRDTYGTNHMPKYL